MLDREKRPTSLLTATDELRQLVIDNPGVPLLVFAGEDCNSGDYCYMSCSGCRAVLGEFLDCMQEVNDECVYTDRDEFQEALEDHYSNFDGSKREFAQFIENRLIEYTQKFPYNGVTAKDVAAMMALLKVARIATGDNADSFIDLAGYAACAGEIATQQEVRENEA